MSKKKMNFYDRYYFRTPDWTTVDTLINEHVYERSQESYVRGLLMGAYLAKQVVADYVSDDDYQTMRQGVEREVRKLVEGLGMDYKDFQDMLTEETREDEYEDF